jgi:pentafunctional AROM polypeptide
MGLACETALAGQKGKEGLKVLVTLLPPGEAAKTRRTKEKIEDAMLAHNCHRDTLLIAFGGGVVGDLGGFVASTYMRGIAFIQLPTTLLAMVDSSIGGKTGLDVPAGKNLIGAFWQPSRVYLGPHQFLSTLPARELSNGYAEVIKAAAIRDATLFDLLEDKAEELLGEDAALPAVGGGSSDSALISVSSVPARSYTDEAPVTSDGASTLFDLCLLDEASATTPAAMRAPINKAPGVADTALAKLDHKSFVLVDGAGSDAPATATIDASVFKVNRLRFTEPALLNRVISWAAGIKAKVVSGDEREGGERALLNFGHTIGHGIEAFLQPSWLHGECVSVGMVKECEAARALGVVSSAVTARLKRVLASYNLPVKIPHAVISSKGDAIEQVFKYMAVDKKNVKGSAAGAGSGAASDDVTASATAALVPSADGSHSFSLATGEDFPSASDPVFRAADRAHRSGIAIKCVLLTAIGSTLDKPGFVHSIPPHLLARLLSSAVSVHPETQPQLPALLPSPSVSSSSPLPIIRVRTPGSKSLSNRALLLAGLCEGTTRITGLLDSDDTQVMMTCLRALGATITVSASGEEAVVVGTGGSGLRIPPASSQPLYVGNAGTASRFLTALLCLLPYGIADGGSVVEIRGNSRMHERPIAPLVDALRLQGADVEYLGGDSNKGCLPLKFKGGLGSTAGGELSSSVTVSPATGGAAATTTTSLVRRVPLAAKLSSQYVSAILMTAPLYPPVANDNDAGFVDIVLAEESPTSLPYILMTCETMKDFGVQVLRIKDNHYRVPRVSYLPPRTFREPAKVKVNDDGSFTVVPAVLNTAGLDTGTMGHFAIEADASSASYPAAIAAITGRSVLLEGVGSASSQGDANFPLLLKGMGCFVYQNRENTLVCGPGSVQEELLTPAVGSGSSDHLASALYQLCFAGGDKEKEAEEKSKLHAALQSYLASSSSSFTNQHNSYLSGLGRINMENETDCFMTMAVLAAVSKGQTVITGISNQRVKECDRIKAMRVELNKLGIDVKEEGDDLVINGLGLPIGCSSSTAGSSSQRRLPVAVPNNGASTVPVLIHCYDDHRIAMSFACLSLAMKTATTTTATSAAASMVLDDSLCVEKTYPTFWEHMEGLFGIAVRGRALDKYAPSAGAGASS